MQNYFNMFPITRHWMEVSGETEYGINIGWIDLRLILIAGILIFPEFLHQKHYNFPETSSI